MEKQVNIIIFVQTFSFEPLPEAQVEIRQVESRQWLLLPFDKGNRYFSLKDLTTGRYNLRVKFKDWIEDNRNITLIRGNNLFYSTIAPEGTQYYTGVEGERVYFRPDEGKILLNLQGKDANVIANNLLSKIGLEGKHVIVSKQKEQTDNLTLLISLPEDAIKRKEVIAYLESNIKDRFSSQGLTGRLALPMFRGESVIEGLTNQIIVKFQSSVNEQMAQKIAKRYKFTIIRRVNYLGNAFLWERKGLPSYDLLKVIQELMSSSPVMYAEPNVLVQIELDVFTPNDYLYPEQQHFQVIHADDAWDTLDDIDVLLRSGSPNITIAVFDGHGVTPNHPKLTGNLTDGTAKMVANFNFTNWTNQTVANLAGDHGTQCASSATAALNTNLGTSGIAGNCHLIGARLPLSVTGIDIADAWIWAAGFSTGSTNPNFPTNLSKGADVISNSWGINGSWNNTIKDALDFLTIYGRNGRGCVICFSVGNLGYTQFSNTRRYAAYERTIAVGATINANPTNPCNSVHSAPNGNTSNLPAVVDTRAYYSPYGPEMDIVAPAHTCYDSTLPGAQIRDPIIAGVRVNQGDWPSYLVASTTLTSAVASGATSIQVDNASGFTLGEYVLFKGPGIKPNETCRITSISSNKLNVTALTNSYPSGTTVITGPNDYAMNPSVGFGGTSHACPTVAGAVALILSTKPELNWIQVREILRNSATIIDTGQTNNVGKWVDNDGDGIKEFSQWYGYGRLNVNAAVVAAHDPATAIADVIVRDNLLDTGSVPSGGWHADSPDIWVRSTDDPIPLIAYNSAPPHENPVRGKDNYVFMRVKNVGNAASNEVYLRVLITHFPGFEFRYPQEWQPTTRPGDPLPTPMVPGTYLIGETRIDNLAPNTEMIVKMTWPQTLIPPETVLVGGINVAWHPCLLAEVSPHDGPLPTGLAFDVKRDNNLAQKNITIENPNDASDDIVVGVLAGTSEKVGIKSIIIDRSQISPSYRVLVRLADERQMSYWLKQLQAGKIQATEPLPNEFSRSRGCFFTLLDSARFELDCCESKKIILHAPANTRMEIKCMSNEKENIPKINEGTYREQRVIFFDGGTDAIELPLSLAANQYLALAIGLVRPYDKSLKGVLKVTQKLGNEELSAGYSIQG